MRKLLFFALTAVALFSCDNRSDPKPTMSLNAQPTVLGIKGNRQTGTIYVTLSGKPYQIGEQKINVSYDKTQGELTGYVESENYVFTEDDGTKTFNYHVLETARPGKHRLTLTMDDYRKVYESLEFTVEDSIWVDSGN